MRWGLRTRMPGAYGRERVISPAYAVKPPRPAAISEFAHLFGAESPGGDSRAAP